MFNLKFLHFVAILFLIASCATKKPPEQLPQASSELQISEEKLEEELKKIWAQYFQESYELSKEIEVFVATNRKSANNSFGCRKNQFKISADMLRFGSCLVSVPKNHQVGEINQAESQKDSVNEVFRVVAENSFDAQNLILALKKANRRPLIFVHGFNVDYKEALFRAAQIAYDLKYQGPIILFSWPAGSTDGVLDGVMINKIYENNLNNAKNSVEAFKNFMILLEKNQIKPNILIHSMGHQVALQALYELSLENQNKIFVNKLILNAPDFETIKFMTIVGKIKEVASHITLYCSSNDKAIIASKTFNNTNRIGACVYLPEIDTIDASEIDDSLLSLGHGYYYSREILTDVFQNLLEINAKQRIFTTRKISAKYNNKYFLRR